MLLRRGRSHYKPRLGRLLAGSPLPFGPGKLLRTKRAAWSRISRPEFHGLIAALSGLERQAAVGAIRCHFRRRRREALAFYVRKFGHVPPLVWERTLKSGKQFYRTAEYKAWSCTAYEPPRPIAGLAARHHLLLLESSDMAPNPSIERPASSKLRLLAAAAHVER